MVNLCPRQRGVAEDEMAYNEIASSMAMMAFGRQFLDELAVGTVFMLLMLRLRRVKGLVQGEDTFVLGLE